MPIPEETVESLAKAWLAESKRLCASVKCDCGCGEAVTPRTRFKSGHDAKLLKAYRKAIREILGNS